MVGVADEIDGGRRREEMVGVGRTTRSWAKISDGLVPAVEFSAHIRR